MQLTNAFAPLVRTTASIALAAGMVALASGLDTADAAGSTLVVTSGPLFGTWDLPQDVNTPGKATGTLKDQAGNPSFTLSAVLTELQTPALAFRLGTIDADLDDGSGAVFPQYGMFGDWTALSLIGTGTFSASMTRQHSPLGPVFLIGKAGGAFRDFPTFPNQAGAFAGRWQADI